MPFTDPVVGGTTLIRSAIHSPDYVPGISGWTINKDGTCEFNDATFRGEVTIIDPLTGRGVIISPTDGKIQLVPPILPPPAVTTDPGYIFTVSNYVAGVSQNSGVSIVSPKLNFLDAASINLNSEDIDGTRPYIIMNGDVIIADTIRVPNGEQFTPGEAGRGTVVVGGAGTSGTLSVSFARPFGGNVPAVSPNIEGGAGVYARWQSRAINITNTGFDLFVFRGVPTDPTYLGNIPVTWQAMNIA